MNGLWARWLPLLLMAWIAGCGTPPPRNETLLVMEASAKTAPYQLPPGAKVALATAWFDPTVTLLDGQDTYIGYRFGTKEGLAMAVASPVYCLTTGLAYPICVATLGIGAPTLGVARDIAGANSEGSPKEKQSSTEPEKGPLSGATESMAAEETAALRQFQPFAKALASMPPMLNRIQRYAAERELGELLVLPKRSDGSAVHQPGHYSGRDYVFEIVVPHVMPRPSIDAPSYWFRIIAWGRVIRVKDGSVVDHFTTYADSNTQIASVWADQSNQLLVTELNLAMDDVAKNIVNQWIKPALNGRH